MPNQFNLPDVGEGLTEAEITAWHVAVGDSVELNQTLLEVETAKAVVELPSPFAGTVLQLNHDIGDVVPVGATLIVIGKAGEELTGGAAPATVQRPAESAVDASPGAMSPLATPFSAAAAEPQDAPGDNAPVPDAEPVREPVLVGYGVRAAKVARRPRKAQPATKASNGVAMSGPLVRRLARSLSVDLDSIKPSGEHGRVTRDDVMIASATLATALAQTPSEIRTPVRGARKHIAQAMVRSAFTAPHVTEWVNVDITRTLKLMRELRVAPATRDLRITPLTLLARAALLTLTRYPEINSSWEDSTSEIVQHRDVNLGVAVASPRGLIVPNIRAAQTLDFPSLCGALSDLVANGRTNTTTVEAMQHGTFTITNVGVFGVDGATPILNPGESAILAFGQTRELPWNHKGQIRLRSVTTLSLSFDHRLVDGELGSKVLTGIGELLEHPARALVR